MNKERTKVGDIEISKRTRKPVICVEVKYNASGNEDSRWISYEKNLLRTRMGMSPESHQLHPLQDFVDVLNANTKRKEVEKKRDALEEKIETLLNEFVANTDVRIETVEVGDGRTGKWVVSIELREDKYT